MRDGGRRAGAAPRREGVARAALPDLDAEPRRVEHLHELDVGAPREARVALEERAERAALPPPRRPRGAPRSADCRRVAAENSRRHAGHRDGLAQHLARRPRHGDRVAVEAHRAPSRRTPCARRRARGRCTVPPAVSTAKGPRRDDAAVEEVAGEDAQPVAALLGLGAVGVDDAQRGATARARAAGCRRAPRPRWRSQRSRACAGASGAPQGAGLDHERSRCRGRGTWRTPRAPQPAAPTRAKARTGKLPIPRTFTGTAKKRKPVRRQRSQVREVLDDRDARGEERRVHRPRAVLGVVDVQRVDADEATPRAAPARAPAPRRGTGCPSAVARRAEVARPAGAEQHRAAAQRRAAAAPRVRCDARPPARRRPRPADRRASRGARPARSGAVGEAVGRRIDVGAGVGDHLDPADLELGALRVALARRLAAEVVGDDRRRQTRIGHQAVFHRVAEVDEAGAHRARAMMARRRRGGEPAGSDPRRRPAWKRTRPPPPRAAPARELAQRRRQPSKASLR